jgi:hypothetical protein
MTWPNLFLAAAPRAGSTQLARWMDSHPDLSLSTVKEPNYFAEHEFDPDYVAASHLDDIDPARPPFRRAQFAVFRRPECYRALFCKMTTRWRFEASTSYLACPESPSRIAADCPDARIILLTREPVARALSHYGLALRTGRTQQRLADEVWAEVAGELPLCARYLLRPSRQDAGVAAFGAAFPPDQILHLTFEEMIAGPAAVLFRIADWLGVGRDGFRTDIAARNASARPRLPRINSLLQHSGAKTVIRRHLPARLKPTLKRLWFTEARQSSVTPQDREALVTALQMP